MNKLITIGLSDQHFTSKPQGKQVGSLAFTITTLSIHELIYKLTQGYCIAHVFGHDDTFTMKEKNNANFTSASFVSVDVDDSSVDMYTYIQGLIHKPSIAYTTFSNQMEGKGYRFRLIYVLSDKVTTVERYKDCYDYFTNGMNLKDNCMQSAAQFVIGTSSSAETYTSDEVYNLEDIPTLRKPNIIIKEMRKSNHIIKEEVKIDEVFLNDFYEMKFSDFIMKYKEVYPFFTSTPLPAVSEDVPYILLPSNYIEIKRYWCTDSVINDKGEVERTYYNRVRRLKDGQGRRKKLFINAILRRMMMEDITVEYLITMLANELYYYICNTTDKITKQEIVTIASNAYRADLSRYNELRVQKHPTFVVNPSYCFKYGCNKKSASNIAKKMILWEQIGSLYDCSLTDKENIKVLNENGVKVSRRTLTTFKQEQGLTKNAQTESYNKRRQEHYTFRIAQIDSNTTMFHSNLKNTEMYNSNFIINENNAQTESYNKREQVHYKVRIAQKEEDNPMCNSNSIIKKEKNIIQLDLPKTNNNSRMSNSNSIIKKEQVHYKVRFTHSVEDEKNNDKNTGMSNSNSIINDCMSNSNSIIKDCISRKCHSNFINNIEQVHYKVTLAHSDYDNTVYQPNLIKKEETVQPQVKDDTTMMTEEEREIKRVKAKANIEELLRRYELITDSDAIIQKYPIVMEYIRGKREYLTQAESAIYLLKANQISRFKIRR